MVLKVMLCVWVLSLWPHVLQLPRLLCSGDFPGKNTGVGCHFLLQETPWPRDGTHVSCVSCIGRYTAPPGKIFESYESASRRGSNEWFQILLLTLLLTLCGLRMDTEFSNKELSVNLTRNQCQWLGDGWVETMIRAGQREQEKRHWRQLT